ncbi:Uncharacterized protein TCM_031229 [Theobroma cacao]|uniref:DUF6598 domain-containing protein n=1 Tax=Theobroma cacao TaxID=3641 RepID=A0A061F5V2_THECC|nr:Uncharacterized protein TCM_031229 [Theobroma cacao]
MADGHTSIAFNVDEGDYQTFIQSLRSILSSSTSHNIGVLMPQTQSLSWLDIRLTSGASTIILRIDKRNLYVRGYSRDEGAKFWEFSDSSMISGSSPLAYAGSYVDGYTLIDAAGQDVTRETLQLGLPNLSNAIANLARALDPNSTQNNALQNCARALLVLTQMIAESTRFQLITDHIVKNWYNSAPLTSQLVELQQGFVSFSSAVQRADLPWTDNTPLPNVPNPNRAHIWTVDTADTNVSYVCTLVSIEYVRVNNINGEDPADLYGTVKIAQGDIVWEPRNENLTFANYDKRLEKVVYGEYGSVMVGYSVLRQALNATIHVVLINGDNELPADVYGTIKASQDLGGSSTSLALFEKSSNEYVQVRPNYSIPLTRSFVVAPASSVLTITADLWDYDTLSFDDQIAKGSAHFDAAVGTQTQSIYGQYGEVQVFVTSSNGGNNAPLAQPYPSIGRLGYIVNKWVGKGRNILML